MKTNIFDLTGQECFACAEANGNDDVKSLAMTPLHTLLIYPRDTSCNKQPYLQNPLLPVIEDFMDEKGNFDFKKSCFLFEVLQKEINAAAQEHLRNYFRYQIGILSEFESEAQNIILISDDYSTEKQEHLLRCCGLPRNNKKTLLLWRSVAICLGAEKELAALGVKQDDRVAIIDVQTSDKVNVSILTMKMDGDKLVPARSSYNKKANYPLTNKSLWNYSSLEEDENIDYAVDDEEKDFWKHTWRRPGKFFVPSGSRWTEKGFGKKMWLCQTDKVDTTAINYFVVSGQAKITFLDAVDKNRIVQERPEQNFAMLGAGRFSVRNANGLPTYFDECESLYFIVQNLLEGKIEAKELIKGNALCRGGEPIYGEVNKESLLKKGDDRVSFLLHVGTDIDEEKTQLKELCQEFGCTATVEQQLTLKPSMIPGQGIAKVGVEASPLLKHEIELDFLKMEDALIEGTSQPKTMRYLQDTLPRSYPVDFPEVNASAQLWDWYCQRYVDAYMRRSKMLPADCFAHGRRKDPSATGIKAYQRENVFGTNSWPFKYEYEQGYMRSVFAKITAEYKKNKKREFIRLAAWTYRCGVNEFAPIIDDVMEKVEKISNNANSESLLQEEATVCANMLSLAQQISFFKSCNKYIETMIKLANGAEIKRIDFWMRAFMWILMTSNTLMENISNEECEETMKRLLDIWENFIENKKNDTQARYIMQVIVCMLFLLRRRKYDYNFLREETASLYVELINYEKTLQMRCSDNCYQSAKATQELAAAFFDYLKSEGSIDIPIGAILGDSDGGMTDSNE